jgi:hypothetical protein
MGTVESNQPKHDSGVRREPSGDAVRGMVRRGRLFCTRQQPISSVLKERRRRHRSEVPVSLASKTQTLKVT